MNVAGNSSASDTAPKKLLKGRKQNKKNDEEYSNHNRRSRNNPHTRLRAQRRVSKTGSRNLREAPAAIQGLPDILLDQQRERNVPGIRDHAGKITCMMKMKKMKMRRKNVARITQ